MQCPLPLPSIQSWDPTWLESPLCSSKMAEKPLWCYAGRTCWESTLWNLLEKFSLGQLFSKRHLTGGGLLGNMHGEDAKQAAGCQELLTTMHGRSLTSVKPHTHCRSMPREHTQGAQQGQGANPFPSWNLPPVPCTESVQAGQGKIVKSPHSLLQDSRKVWIWSWEAVGWYMAQALNPNQTMCTILSIHRRVGSESRDLRTKMLPSLCR